MYVFGLFSIFVIKAIQPDCDKIKGISVLLLETPLTRSKYFSPLTQAQRLTQTSGTFCTFTYKQTLQMSKSGLTVLYELEVKAGVIDPDFTGNVGVVLKNNSDQLIERLAGEQIAQLLFIKVATPILIQVNSLAKTEWGKYGFGAHTN